MTLSTPDQIAVPIPCLDEAGTIGSVVRELRREAPGLHVISLPVHAPPRPSGGRPRVRLIRDRLRIPAAIAVLPLRRPLRIPMPPGVRPVPVAAGLPAAGASALVPAGPLPPLARRAGRATPFSPRASRV